MLALDSDVVINADPYPSLRGPFGGYKMIIAYDTKGGFANVNVGVMYLQNASDGPGVEPPHTHTHHRHHAPPHGPSSRVTARGGSRVRRGARARP